MNEINCHRAEVLIHQRLDHEIEKAHSSDLDRHLHSCAPCARNMRQARGLERLLATMEIPSAESARQATRARIAEWVARPAHNTLRLPIQRAKSYPRWAIASLLLLTVLVSFAGWMIVSKSPQSVPEPYVISFTDRSSIWDSLNHNVLLAASLEPGAAQARVHAELTETLTGAMLFGRNDALPPERDTGIAYIRTFHRAVLPDITAGLLESEEARRFEAQQKVLSSLGANGDPTVTAAAAMSAHAVDLLRQRTSSPPLVALPAAGSSLISVFSETSVEMRQSTTPEQRAKLLGSLSGRVVAELNLESTSKVVAARLHKMALRISAEGIQVQVRRASGNPASRTQLAQVLKEDAQRLTALLQQSEQSGGSQQALQAAIKNAQSSNAGLLQELLKTSDPAPVPQTQDKKPGAALPDAGLTKTALIDHAAPAETPALNVVNAGVQTPNDTPAAKTVSTQTAPAVPNTNACLLYTSPSPRD